MANSEVPTNVRAIIRQMNTPRYDFNEAVRRLQPEELQRLMNELARIARMTLGGDPRTGFAARMGR